MAISGLTMPKQLFFKLLFGFWLICMVITGTIVALPSIIEHQRNPEQKLLAKHQMLVSRLAQSRDLAQTINQWQHRINQRRQPELRHQKGRRLSFFVLTENNSAFDQVPVPRDISLAVIRHQDNPQSKSYHFKRWIVFGPYHFVNQGTPYQLYVRDFHAKHQRHILATISENRWLLLFIVMLVSGVSCGFLAWHITKPIKSLDKTAQRLAQGDLSTRAEETALSHRDEIGQLAHSFNDMASSVEQMMTNQQRLLSDISHELRTPLTRLQLALAISRRQHGDFDQAQRIEQEAQLIDKMLQQLLLLSRIHLNKNQQFESISLDHLLDDIIDNAIFEARTQHKTIITDLAADCKIWVQYEPLASAIENVIRNAIRYAHSQVSLTTIVTATHLTITIEDDGTGVEQQHLAQLFEPFYRASSSRDRSTGGTGLGLAITAEAINSHHGTIKASNATNSGLIVSMTIPIGSSF